VFCPECGFRNSDGAGFCARCGVSLVPEQPDDQTTISDQPSQDDAALAPVAGLARGQATLVIRSGGGRAGETYALEAERTTIGRHPDADIFLDDVTVSRNHAVLQREASRYVLLDEGSLNGTFVNRRRSEKSVLDDGDEIQIGKYKLTFIVP
jgi:pSer/pThr/pTyr-binding forkhead associated (FHA) protein